MAEEIQSLTGGRYISNSKVRRLYKSIWRGWRRNKHIMTLKDGIKLMKSSANCIWIN